MAHEDLLDLTYYRGRVALHSILKGLGIGRGDEVITQAFTCVAVPEGILAAGARPVYADVEPGGFNLDPEDLPQKITSQTRAIVVQHTFGIPAQMPRIMQIADEYGIPIIEDCCHTLESKIHGRQVGTFGIAAFYSYEWGKPIVVGIGGSARVNDAALLAKLKSGLAEYQVPGLVGRMKLALQYQVHNVLYRPALYWPLKSVFHSLSRLKLAKGNYNPVGTDEEVAEDFRLAMGPSQKQRLETKLKSGVDAYTAHSSHIVRRLQTELAGARGIQLPVMPENSEPVLARFPIRVEDKQRTIREARRRNIELAEWYATPVHPIPSSQGKVVCFEPEMSPQAENRTREIVSLPLHHRVTDAYVDKVVEFFQRAA